MTKLVTDISVLKTPLAQTHIGVDDAENIANSLFSILKEFDGIGLSANQVGYTERICVINVQEPIWLLNPRIIEYSEEIVSYVEGCLSIPNTIKKPIKTRRSLDITIAADNFANEIKYGADLKGKWDTPYEFWHDAGLLECVSIQHEIDHLNGITIYDRLINPPIRVKKLPGRNEKVMFKNKTTEEFKFIKYKKGKSLGEDWEVV